MGGTGSGYFSRFLFKNERKALMVQQEISRFLVFPNQLPVEVQREREQETRYVLETLLSDFWYRIYRGNGLQVVCRIGSFTGSGAPDSVRVDIYREIQLLPGIIWRRSFFHGVVRVYGKGNLEIVGQSGRNSRALNGDLDILHQWWKDAIGWFKSPDPWKGLESLPQERDAWKNYSTPDQLQR